MKNPNQDFDALIWKPKKRFLRRLMARYVDYVEVAGYIFAIMLGASIVWAWFVPAKVWVDSSDSELKPASSTITAPQKGTITSVLVTNKDLIGAGTPLLVLNTGSDAEIVLHANRAGHVFVDTGFKSLAGMQVDSGKTLLRIADFDTLRIDFEVKGNNSDSISIGDSAEIKLVNPSAVDGLLILRNGKQKVTGNFVSPVSNEFSNELKSAFVGQQVTSRNQGLYEVKNIKKASVIIEFAGKPEENVDISRSLVASDVPFYGTIEKGKRAMEVEVVVPFPAAAVSSLDKWADGTLRNAPFSIGGVGYRYQDSLAVRLRIVKLEAEADLATYIPFEKRREQYKNMKESNGTETKATGTILIVNPPVYVKELARKSFGGNRAQYLKTKVRINTYKIPWGKRMIKK